MEFGLEDRTAVITGADSGIGWHTAQELLDEGAKVVISDRDQDRLDDAANQLRTDADRLFAVAADIADPDAVQRLREAVRRIDRVDIVINSAGTSGPHGAFEQIDDAGWSETIEVDLMGPVRVSRAFLDDLRSSGHGRLIFITSENAVQPYPDEIPYDAAKAALLATAKGLSKSYGSDGLLVNCVSPAFIATPMTDAMMAQRATELGVSTDEAVSSFLAEERSGIVLQRRGLPEEVAAVITFLCSDRASFVNGSNYRVDAGSVATIN